MAMSVQLVQRRIRAVACLAVASVPLTLSACGASSQSDSGSSVTKPSVSTSRDTSTPTSASTKAQSIAEGEALVAYRGMWADMASAARTADYQDPILAQHASGAALSVLVQGLYSYRQEGLVIMGTPVTHATITSVAPAANPTVANVSDCFDDTHWLAYKASGGLENNVPGGHRQVSAVVTDTNGTWKVTTLETGAEGSC
jgi:hypothetical protein